MELERSYGFMEPFVIGFFVDRNVPDVAIPFAQLLLHEYSGQFLYRPYVFPFWFISFTSKKDSGLRLPYFFNFISFF